MIFYLFFISDYKIKSKFFTFNQFNSHRCLQFSHSLNSIVRVCFFMWLNSLTLYPPRSFSLSWTDWFVFNQAKKKQKILQHLIESDWLEILYVHLHYFMYKALLNKFIRQIFYQRWRFHTTAVCRCCRVMQINVYFHIQQQASELASESDWKLSNFNFFVWIFGVCVFEEALRECEKFNISQ